ncbi:flagellar brake protein [Neptunomonas sp. CHC150]|uniref:flagellar brake protein n=1 Tax=Neptunomonas TaxID=75687 RepID=UPI000948E0E0|nr:MULTISPECIES: flagellar brake protein [Neptunomonas]MDN2659751.1 flagellar brake protein [Neptunomonas sp. CHC150]
MIRQLSSSQTALSFTELNPDPGVKMTLSFQSPRKSFTVNYIGVKSDASVICTMPKAAASLNLEGQRLTVKMMAGNRMCAFSCRLIKSFAHPYPHWHLEYPSVVNHHTVRYHPRIPVNMAVSVDHQDEQQGIHLGLPRIVHTRDISLEGMGLESPVPLGQVGDELFVTMRFDLNGLDQVLLLAVQLQNVEEVELGVFLHGVKFDHMEEDSALIMTAFVYQCYLSELGYLHEHP